MGAQTLRVSPLAAARAAPGRVGQVSSGRDVPSAERSALLQTLEASEASVLELPCVWHTQKDACWLCLTQRSPRWPVGQAVGKLVSSTPRCPSVSPGLRRDSLKVRGAWCEMGSRELEPTPRSSWPQLPSQGPRGLRGLARSS